MMVSIPEDATHGSMSMSRNPKAVFTAQWEITAYRLQKAALLRVMIAEHYY